VELMNTRVQRALLGDRRCTAHLADGSGKRCGAWAMAGQAVCVAHGGATPEGRAAGLARLRALVEPVLSVFDEVVQTWRETKCPHCGQGGDPSHVIRIGHLVLDRTGYGPSSHLSVDENHVHVVISLPSNEREPTIDVAAEPYEEPEPPRSANSESR